MANFRRKLKIFLESMLKSVFYVKRAPLNSNVGSLTIPLPLITQMLLSENFSMNTKLGFHQKIVPQKHFCDQGVCHTNTEKFYRRTHFSSETYLCILYIFTTIEI